MTSRPLKRWVMFSWLKATEGNECVSSVLFLYHTVALKKKKMGVELSS